MTFASWLRSAGPRHAMRPEEFPPGATPSPAVDPRLAVEGLEDRTVPSVTVITSTTRRRFQQ